ncbi:TetR/AcrR family transcriptional regulator [Defluviimonas sp. SAOS-178_SWC]|uniref:TetR/AcrR family transcriptional regulator n=1 Tax=Defluviimonas sp. SAOS-178_SWC TaxID=3121287 RepID=UPI0032213EFE
MSAESRKAEIIAATLRLADELGPDRLTTQAIADAVGLTQPGIFRHFRTKQALWQAVGEAMDAQMSANWDAVLSKAKAPEDRLRALILTQLAQIERTPAIPAILHSRELQAENPDLHRRFRTIMMRFLGLLAAELERARGMGLIRRGLDPGDGALLLISLVQSLAMRWTLGGRAFTLQAEGRRLLETQLALMSRPADEGRTG